jgi:hypothetical protein
MELSLSQSEIFFHFWEGVSGLRLKHRMVWELLLKSVALATDFTLVQRGPGAWCGMAPATELVAAGFPENIHGLKFSRAVWMAGNWYRHTLDWHNDSSIWEELVMKFTIADQEIFLLQFVMKGPGDVTRYIVSNEDSLSEKLRLMVPRVIQTSKMTPLNLDEDNDKFWLVYTADCAWPGLYLVRATDAGEALEVYLDKTDHATISAEDIKDYDENAIHYADCGKRCDTESTGVHELELVAMITAAGEKHVYPPDERPRIPKGVSIPLRSDRFLDLTQKEQ